LRPKTIDATTSAPGLPTTGSQDTQQNEQDDNMSRQWSGASDDSELAQWEVLERIEAMKATTISTHFMVKTMMRVF
jgi:hypothetical protein